MYYLEMNDSDLKVDGYGDVSSREAVRAIIINNNKLLMIHTNLGDYKFPGGGVEKNESHAESLSREVEEETGFLGCKIINKSGVVTEKNLDMNDKNKIFVMTSHYYICRVSGEKGSQNLDHYEALQNFTPVWIGIDEAISKNRLLCNDKNITVRNEWIKRELNVLEELKKQQCI